MSELLSIPATGVVTAQLSLGAVAASLANQDTPGFGQPTVLVAEGAGAPGRSSTVTIGGVPAPGLLGLDGGALAISSPIAFTGTPHPSSDATALALTGPGFFVVRTPSGQTAYTRAGLFAPDAQGLLTLPDGSTLEPPVILPPNGTWHIGADGTVTVLGRVVGHIPVAAFTNPGGLRSAGASLWTPTAASGPAVLGIPGQAGLGQIRLGFVNGSGVSLSTAFADLIAAQAQYQANTDALRVGQQTLAQLTSQPL